MNNDRASKFVHEQIKRVSAFRNGVVGDVNEFGKLDVNSGERAHARTQIGTVLAQPVTPGSFALMLAGGENDQASALGYSPFLGG